MQHPRFALRSILCKHGEGSTAGIVPETTAPGSQTSASFNFHFRTDRCGVGKVIGTGRKHPTVEAVLPIPTYGHLIEQLQAGGKEAEVILDAVKAMIDAAAREQINGWRESNGLEKDFNVTAFDLGKLTLTAIAQEADRASAAINDEDWTAFLNDYTHVMVQDRWLRCQQGPAARHSPEGATASTSRTTSRRCRSCWNS